MKRSNEKSSLLFVLVFLLIVSVTFCIMSVEARKHHTKKSKPRKHQKDKGGADSGFPGPAAAPLPHYGSYPTQPGIFDVLSFGAKGDGVSDDTKVINQTVLIQTSKGFFLLPERECE